MNSVQSAAEARDIAERITECASRMDIISSICERRPGAMLSLARAYLAEHPADDGVAISEEWASSLSQKQSTEDGDVWVLGMSDVGSTVTLLHRHDETGDFWALYMGSVKLQMMVTRGDVRRLCAALGIPLRETKERERWT